MTVEQVVVDDANDTRGAHFSALIRGRLSVMTFALGTSAALVVAIVQQDWIVAAVAPAGLGLLILIISFAVASSRAEADFFRTFAKSHGFDYIGSGVSLAATTPLLGAGVNQKYENYMEGPLTPELAGVSCGLAHYTYQTIESRTDSSGHQRTSHESHRFTVCVVDLPVNLQVYPGIWLGRKRGPFGWFSAQDGLSRSNHREVELESSVFCDRYKLLVKDRQDDLALRRLFTPQFIDWLAGLPVEVAFEYYAGTLVSYLDGHEDKLVQLDILLQSSGRIAERLNGELVEAVRDSGTAGGATHAAGSNPSTG